MPHWTAVITRSLAALLIAGTTLAVNGQTDGDAITVDVPFAFTVGGVGFAPGTYQFSRMSSQFLLAVTRVRDGDREIFDVHPGRQRTPEQHGHLVFRDAADPSVLNEVHFPGTDSFSQVIERRPGKLRNLQASAAGSPSPSGH